MGSMNDNQIISLRFEECIAVGITTNNQKTQYPMEITVILFVKKNGRKSSVLKKGKDVHRPQS
jgi:hypothetical protein